MKKARIYFLFLITLLIAPVMMLFGQDTIPEPTSLADVLTNLGLYLGSFPGIVVLITFLTALVLRFIPKIQGKVAKFMVTLGVSLLAVTLCNIFNYGFVAHMTWLVAILNGVGAAICSSLLFSVAVMKQILEWIEGQTNKQ